jgi:hypothetical protein
MNQETKNKFAEILAAQQAKANNIQPVKPVNEPTKEENKQLSQNQDSISEPAKMLSFTIIWHEGYQRYENKVFNKWYHAQRAMINLWNDNEKDNKQGGYTKVKINVKWVNGAEITDRADLGHAKGDFNPFNETIGEYLSKQISVMYESNLKQGERVNLSFKDSETEETNAEVKPELSAITVSDLLNEPEQPKSNLILVDYSEKAFAIIGETKPIKEQLKQLGGKFNSFLTCGAGWIFPKTKINYVKAQLSI